MGSSDDSGALRFLAFLVKVASSIYNQRPPDNINDGDDDYLGSEEPTRRGHQEYCHDERTNVADEGGNQASDGSEESTVRDQAARQCH